MKNKEVIKKLIKKKYQSHQLNLVQVENLPVK
jgi:hypothetical protein